MNYNKNSRKMTARNIVMLIGVVLGIQAGFVSHAMEKKSFQSLKNAIEEGKNEIKEVNKIPLRRRNSFTEYSRNDGLDKVNENEYKQDNFSEIDNNDVNQEDLENDINEEEQQQEEEVGFSVAVAGLMNDINDDYEHIYRKKEEILKKQRENVEALQKVFNTEPLLNVASSGNEDVDDMWSWFEMIFYVISMCGFNNFVDKNICKEFEYFIQQNGWAVSRKPEVISEFLQFCLVVFVNGLDAFSDFLEKHPVEGNENQDYIDFLVNKLSYCWKKVKDEEFDFFYKNVLDAELFVGESFDKKLDETFNNLAYAFGTMLKNKVYGLEEEKESEEYYYYCDSCFLVSHFVTFIRYLLVFSIEQLEKQRFEVIKNILMLGGQKITDVLNSSKGLQEFYATYHELNSFVRQSYDKFVEYLNKSECYLKCNYDNFKDFSNKLAEDSNSSFSIVKGHLLNNCLEASNRVTERFTKFKEEYDELSGKFKRLYSELLRNIARDNFSGKRTDLNDGAFEYEENEEMNEKEQASLVGVVNEFLKDFNILVKEEERRAESESLTLDDLKAILNTFKDKSFDKEIFLSDAIYKAFEKEVLDNESFKVELAKALNALGEIDETFSKKTLQKSSEALLSILKHYVLKLHEIFKQTTGIWDLVSEVYSQIDANEIKEEIDKNEIEEEKNDIQQESYTMNEKEQAACLGKVVNEFLKDFNQLMGEDHEAKPESFTLGDLKELLNKFENKSFKKEIFLIKEIYDEFEDKVSNNESFKVALGYVLKALGKIETIFSNETTLQQISKDVNDDKFGDETVEKLANLKQAISELHTTFKQTGILDEDSESNLQINEDEIKEAKNEIKEEKNDIRKEINIASNAERNRKDKEIIKESHSKLLLKTDDKASEFDKEFTELKQQFDEILKGIGTDENNIKKAVELAFKMFVLIVKQISKKTKNFPVFELSFRDVLNIKFELIRIYFNKIEESLKEVNNNEKLKSKLTDSEVQWVNTFIGKMSEIAFVKNKENFVKFDRNTGDIVNLNIDKFKKLIIFFKDIFDSWQKFIKPEFKI